MEHPGEIVNVTELHLHPKFTKNRDGSYSYDFCLAKVTPINLMDCESTRADSSVFSETFFQQKLLKTISQCVIAGWGVTENGVQSVALREANVTLLSERICNKTYHGNNFDIFCAGLLNTPNAQDACLGDSGGPLYCKNQNDEYIQYGLVSGGKTYGKCGQKNTPGIRVSRRTFKWT
mgnify:CR=1 FL=1